MTGTLLLVTVCAGLAGGATIAAIAVVTMVVHKEERHRTLTRPVPDRMTHAVRRVNGVYVRTPDGVTYSGHNELPGRRATARMRRVPQEQPLEAAGDFPPGG
jgi:hypothetical protein